ncbi:MAG: hypothetical protein HOQ24_11415 [Mycobacteriaceae bacterium]|nr:hypothetical protein [Mycobacteriaceae bacterium]
MAVDRGAQAKEHRHCVRDCESRTEAITGKTEAMPLPDDVRTAEHVARVYDLLTRPCAEPPKNHSADEHPGQDFMLVVLRASGEFWSHEWDDTDDFDEYYNSESNLIDAEYTALLAALTQEWGTPSTIDLEVFQPALVAQDPLPAVAEALIFDMGCHGAFPAWHRESRWIGITQAQVGKECSICLIAVITADRIDHITAP